tara:strand:- start:2744 stop:3193 length:450 start_codon:yes stop_codon:yes gene_type:complete
MVLYDPKNIPLYYLPEDIIWLIGKYVRDHDKIWLCKRYYFTYHHLVFESGLKREKVFDDYMRKVLRNNSFFVLTHLLELFGSKWILYPPNKRWKYKNMVFPSYMDMVIYWSKSFKSGRCENNIIDYLKNNGFSTNRYKQNKQRNIKWIN